MVYDIWCEAPSWPPPPLAHVLLPAGDPSSHVESGNHQSTGPTQVQPTRQRLAETQECEEPAYPPRLDQDCAITLLCTEPPPTHVRPLSAVYDGSDHHPDAGMGGCDQTSMAPYDFGKRGSGPHFPACRSRRGGVGRPWRLGGPYNDIL
ncbi:hypothetical protein GDO81_025668 [Engystomops pustulosus]|uniref:Uncharacterized protein n=1 Tax=Engystomops pustulosus TaxID=76066 RepID=A0AAV6YL31_ENGPU|nr:hypothetical protein GDO81_025668 [Engystomops pustulosus]